MSKKKKADHSDSKKAGRKENPGDSKKLYFALAAVLILTLIIYFPSLKNELVSLDDDGYVINNPLIQHFSLKLLFTSYWMGNYHPFVLAVYTFIYSVAKDSPFAYHLINLLIHLLNTAVVLFLIYDLVGIFEVAVAVSLFFGIHPMHVESVAWVSELKDLMYTSFFLFSLLFYIKFVKSGLNKKYFVLSLIFFLFSLFSKGMGVSLALVLLLVDYFMSRKIELKIFIEKIPFFFLSIVFGIIAINAQQDSGAIPSEIYDLPHRIVFACCGFVLYIVKLIAPLNLSAYYLYPTSVSEKIPGLFYIFPVLIFLIIAVCIYSFKKNKIVFFGICFFAATIFLVLQLIPVGSALMADRYTYIPSIGIFLILCCSLNYLYRSKLYKRIALGLFLIFSISFSLLAYQRTEIWKNSMNLYNDILKSGEVPMAYSNRGVLFQNAGDYVSAEKDFNKAIELSPDYKEAYMNRSNLLIGLGKYDQALPDCNKTIELDSLNPKAYYNRGALFYSRGDYQKALPDYDKSIELNSLFTEAYCNRANIYDVNQQYDLAIADYSKAIQFNSSFALAYSNRARVYIKLKRLGEACQDLKTAYDLGNKDAYLMYNDFCK
ncbi:MAG: tetratricopeptide repeat protein [Bacteroidota bacterium]